MKNVTIEMVYEEIKNVDQKIRGINQRVATLEHFLIPEETLSEVERKEIEEAIRDTKSGKSIPFSGVNR